MRWCLILALIFISLMISDIEHSLCIFWSSICHSYLIESLDLSVIYLPFSTIDSASYREYFILPLWVIHSLFVKWVRICLWEISGIQYVKFCYRVDVSYDLVFSLSQIKCLLRHSRDFTTPILHTHINLLLINLSIALNIFEYIFSKIL